MDLGAFQIDATHWAFYGMVLPCLLVLVAFVAKSTKDREHVNQRRMIELPESIDRRLAEQERKDDP